MSKNRICNKTAFVFIIILGFLAIVSILYFTMMRGWVSQIKPNQELVKEACSVIDNNVNDLKAYTDSFEYYCKESEKSFTSYAEYFEDINAAEFYISNNTSDENKNFDTIFFCISDKNNPCYKSWVTDISGNDKDAYKTTLNKKYGAIDPFYQLFSNEIIFDDICVYFSPFSRERSEIYSFTGVKVINGIITTPSSVICFSIRTHKEDYNNSLESFFLYFRQFNLNKNGPIPMIFRVFIADLPPKTREQRLEFKTRNRPLS